MVAEDAAAGYLDRVPTYLPANDESGIAASITLLVQAPYVSFP